MTAPTATSPTTANTALFQRTVLVALAYAGLGYLGLVSALERDLWPTLWFPSAVGLTAVTFWGPRAALGVGIGALLLRLGSRATPTLTLIAVVANTLEAYLGGLLLREHFGLPDRRLSTRDIPRLVFALALVTNISAFVGIASQIEFGLIPAGEAFRGWWSWWAGDAAAVILIVPIWLWRSERESSADVPVAGRHLFGVVGIATGLVLCLLPKPGGPTPIWRPTLAFLPYLLVHWATLSLGARSVAFGGAVVGVVVSFATNIGRGPFASADPIASFDAACLFNLVTGTSTLWLSTLAAERNQQARALERHREHLEATVLQRTRALEERTRELQAFSYAVSHDLRAPLRGVCGWILALEEDCAASLDETGRGHLERIRTESERMGTLIEGLLSLSRISSSEIRHVTVDVSGLASAILRRLAESQPGRAVETAVTPGIRVVGDPMLCEIALTNVLENAWKFTARSRPARIELLPAAVHGGSGFQVRDNGAGFDPSNRSRLFIPFQRFHRASEFPGTGIGLATVQRVAQRHGGSVHVESEPGRGTTVALHFPDPPSPTESRPEPRHAP